MYDKENDILAVHKGFDSGERFASNVTAGDLVLDVSTRGRVRGIEILNARGFLADAGIPRNAPLDAVAFEARTRKSAIYVKLLVKTPAHEHAAMIAVPMM